MDPATNQGEYQLLAFALTGQLESATILQDNGFDEKIPDYSYKVNTFFDRLNPRFAGTLGGYKTYKNESLEAASLTLDELKEMTPELMEKLGQTNREEFEKIFVEPFLNFAKTLPECNVAELPYYVILIKINKNVEWTANKQIVLNYQPERNEVILPTAHEIHPDGLYKYDVSALVSGVKSFDFDQAESFFKTIDATQRTGGMQNKTLPYNNEKTGVHGCLNCSYYASTPDRGFDHSGFVFDKKEGELMMRILPRYDFKSNRNFLLSI